MTIVIGLAGCGGSSGTNDVPLSGGEIVSFRTLPGTGTSAKADGISGDGRVVFGSLDTRPAFWIGNDRPLAIPTIKGRTIDSLDGASHDGTTLVGSAGSSTGSQIFRRDAAGRLTLTSLPTGFRSARALDVSADGSRVLGEVSNGPEIDVRECVWEAGVPLVGPNGFYGDTLSGNGRFAVGTRGGQPARWTVKEELEITLIFGIEGRADDVSDDGTVVVGSTGNGPTERTPFRWTEAGERQTLSTTVTGEIHVSGDGNTIVGVAESSFYGNRPFIWTAERGLRYLTDLFRAPAAPFAGLLSPNPTGISRDGKTIVGTGQSGSATKAWKLVMN